MSLPHFVLCMLGAVFLGFGLGAARFGWSLRCVFDLLRVGRHDQVEAELVDALSRSRVWQWPKVLDALCYRWKQLGVRRRS